MATKSAEAKNDTVDTPEEEEFFDYSNLTEAQLEAEEKRLSKISEALANRKKEFANKAFTNIEKAMKDAGISPRQMIAYLQPKAELEGLDIRWVYIDAKGKKQFKDFKFGQRGANSIKNAIDAKLLNKEDALKSALTDKGRELVESWFKAE